MVFFCIKPVAFKTSLFPVCEIGFKGCFDRDSRGRWRWRWVTWCWKKLKIPLGMGVVPSSLMEPFLSSCSLPVQLLSITQSPHGGRWRWRWVTWCWKKLKIPLGMGVIPSPLMKPFLSSCSLPVQSFSTFLSGPERENC